MTEMGKAAVFMGVGEPFEIREYPVPDPEPGAILVKITMATICGSDIHIWRGELDLVNHVGVQLPAVIGHPNPPRGWVSGRSLTTVSLVVQCVPDSASRVLRCSVCEPLMNVGVLLAAAVPRFRGEG